MDEYLVWLDCNTELEASSYSDLYPRKAAEAYARDNYDGGWKSISVNVKDVEADVVYKFKLTAKTEFDIERIS